MILTCGTCGHRGEDGKDYAHDCYWTFRGNPKRTGQWEGWLMEPHNDFDKIDGADECLNYAPPSWTGTWREWHRGHGCKLDDSLTPSAKLRKAARFLRECRGNEPFADVCERARACEDAADELDRALAKWEEWKRIAYNWKQDCDDLLVALKVARDVLVGYQKQVGYLPEQGGYLTRMTDAERNIGRAVSDLDVIIAKAEGQ